MAERAGDRPAPSRVALVLAFATVYVVWGSTYLAIRYAIETIPPFLMAGARFLVAGGVLYAWARVRGAAAPTRAHWRSAAVVGALLLFVGNGGVTWAEQRVPSGTAALLVATVPLWLVLLQWAKPGIRPSGSQLAGVALGLAGVGLLVAPGGAATGAPAPAASLIGAAVLVVASFAWASGSLYARTAELPSSMLLGSAMEMVCGGALLLVVGLAAGEGARLDLAAASTRSVLAFVYLIIFGSLLGFSAYTWLLGATTPARVGTYAYVNPVVAVGLGWALGGEQVGARAVAAMVVIVTGVVLLTLGRRQERTPSAPVAASTPPSAPAPQMPELASRAPEQATRR